MTKSFGTILLSRVKGPSIRKLSIAIIGGWAVLCAVTLASAADPSPQAPGAVMTSTKTAGQVSIVPEPRLSNGELILKVAALNQSKKPATFGPEDVQISTADGKAVPIMGLDALIAQVKAQTESGPMGSGSYNSSYAPAPATTSNQYGPPNINNFAGPSAPVGGQINPEAMAVRTQQMASLRAGILQDVTIAPGEVKGGEVVTERIRFRWREKHTLRIDVRFNGEQHEFALSAPPG